MSRLQEARLKNGRKLLFRDLCHSCGTLLQQWGKFVTTICVIFHCCALLHFFLFLYSKGNLSGPHGPFPFDSAHSCL